MCVLTSHRLWLLQGKEGTSSQTGEQPEVGDSEYAEEKGHSPFSSYAEGAFVLLHRVINTSPSI